MARIRFAAEPSKSFDDDIDMGYNDERGDEGRAHVVLLDQHVTLKVPHEVAFILNGRKCVTVNKDMGQNDNCRYEGWQHVVLHDQQSSIGGHFNLERP